MGRLLFWCNVGSAAVVVVGACVLYPTARALCDPEVQAFAAAPGGRGGVQALVSCGQRLAQHGAAWGEEHAADIAAEAWLQAQDAAAWAAQTALVLAVHLWHALCAAWRVVAAFLGHALPLVCSAGQSAGRALADARPLDTALGLARKATILGRATAAALESSSAFLCGRAAAAAEVGSAVGECLMKEHGTTCMLTDPDGFDAARHSSTEMRWARAVALLLVKMCHKMQVRGSVRSRPRCLGEPPRRVLVLGQHDG
jgi:hypothetical protein